MLKIRVDDFPGTKPEEFYRHNLESFKRFDELFKRRDLSYILGVIPRHVTDEQMEWLSVQPNIEIAMHGVNHDERHPNEFREYETVSDVVESIGRVLEEWITKFGVSPTGYIPPHNVIDAKTVRALSQLKFKELYGGPGSDALVMRAASENHGLTCHYSHHPLEYGRSDEMGGSIPHLRSLRLYDESVGFMALHWTWETNIGLDHLDRFLTAVFDA